MASFDEIERAAEQARSYAESNYERDIAMSERFAKAQQAADWNNNPFFDLSDANKSSRNPIERTFNSEDIKNIKSDTGTIAWNTFRKSVLDLNSFGDKAEMALGNTLAGISGNTIGTEMRDRAADNLMKTMEESRFIDANYGDADSWTARWVGGAMSMGEMIAIGMLTSPVGLGGYVGTLSLSDGALNDAVKYAEEHDGSLEGYKTDPANLALDYGNAVFQVASELMLGTGRLVNGKFLKAGKTASAIAKETLDNFIQESTQGLASDVTEVLKGNQDIEVLKENAAGYIKDGVVAGVLGGFIGGSAYKLNKNRALTNLDKINKVLHPEMNEKQVREVSESVFEKTEQQMNKSFAPELVAQAEAVNDRGKIRENIRQKVEMMYRDNEDMTEKQKAKAIEATTTTELENMLYDSIEKKIPLTAHPLLQGEVNELGWFRDGIPENRRAEINALNDEIKELKAQRTQAMESKDYTKLDELDTKIEEFRKNLPNKIKDLVVADREEIKKMLDEQRKAVENSQTKKRLFAKVKQMATSAIEKQKKEEAKLAEQMALGAEKARAKREKAETTQQTKEAKIRTLNEQRQIASAIKRMKVKVEQNKVAQPSVQVQYEEESGYNTLKEAGLTDEEIQKMSYRDMMDTLETSKKAQNVEQEPTIQAIEIPVGEMESWAGKTNIEIADKLIQEKLVPVFEELKKLTNKDGVIPESSDNGRKAYDIVKNTDFRPIVNALLLKYDIDQDLENWLYSKDIADNLIGYGKDESDYQNNLDAVIQDMNEEDPDGTPLFGVLDLEETTFTKSDYNKDLQNLMNKYQEKGDIALYMIPKSIDDLINRIFTHIAIKYMDATDNVDLSFDKIYKEKPAQVFLLQSKAGQAGGKDTFRGYYQPEYRFIAMTENMDASTLAHELAHDWGQEYFRWARSGKASESFMRSWGAVEKAIGITENDTYFTYDASEKFARAYEGWLLERKDWADILHIDNDEQKKAVEEMMEDYRKELVDIYDSLTNPYFTMAWGKVGELKPELKEWFERSTKFDSLDEQVRRGEITAEQASEEKLKDMMETATNNTVQNMSTEDKQAVKTIENLEKLETQTKETANRFDVEGGNRNAIQARLNQIALAKDLTANDAVLERYDTHRDMLEVAKSADEFVKNRREDAIKIINGEMAEQDGLYASDLYTALERVAKQTGDFELIDELRHSKVAKELAKELGQKVAGFRNYTGNGDVDIVSALKKVDKIYEKAYNETEKDNLADDLKGWAEDLQAADSLSDAKLDEFFKDMECQ